MFERFTDRARRVVVLARDEARTLNHNYIGTEHILLGLIHEGEGVAAKALHAVDISMAEVRYEVEEIIGRGHAPPAGHIPFTPHAKKVLELSLREAFQLGHNYIGTEHILLGLIREGEGVAAQVLQKMGADLDPIRRQIVQLLQGLPARRLLSPGEHEQLEQLGFSRDQPSDPIEEDLPGAAERLIERGRRFRALAQRILAATESEGDSIDLMLGMLLNPERLAKAESEVDRVLREQAEGDENPSQPAG